MRVIYSVIYYYSHEIPDTNLYYELAQEIIAQGRILYDTSHPYYEFPGPVIPWINALTMLVFGVNYLGLYLVTSLASAFITYYTYKTARLILDARTSLFAGIWSALYLFYFYYTPTPGKDIWMAFFMIYLIYMLLKLFILDKFRYPGFIWFTTMFVISFHLDERFFVFTPFIFLFILYHDTRSFSRLRIERSLIFACLVILLMVPWTIRNYHKHDKIVILSTRTEVFTDKLFGYESRGHMMDKFNDIYGAFYIHDYQIDSVIRGEKTVTDGGRTISKAQVEAMKRGELPRPLTGIRAVLSRLATMFEPFQVKGRYERTGYFYYKKSLRHNLATFLFYGILFFFSFPGFYQLFKKNKPVFYVLISTIIIYAMVHALTIPYTNWRYRLPLDAVFIMMGCYGMVIIYNQIKVKIFKIIQ